MNQLESTFISLVEEGKQWWIYMVKFWTRDPLHLVQLSSFSCSFRQSWPNNRSAQPPLTPPPHFRVGAPLWNPRSDTGKDCWTRRSCGGFHTWLRSGYPVQVPETKEADRLVSDWLRCSITHTYKQLRISHYVFSVIGTRPLFLRVSPSVQSQHLRKNGLSLFSLSLVQ